MSHLQVRQHGCIWFEENFLYFLCNTLSCLYTRTIAEGCKTLAGALAGCLCAAVLKLQAYGRQWDGNRSKNC